MEAYVGFHVDGEILPKNCSMLGATKTTPWSWTHATSFVTPYAVTIVENRDLEAVWIHIQTKVEQQFEDGRKRQKAVYAHDLTAQYVRYTRISLASLSPFYVTQPHRILTYLPRAVSYQQPSPAVFHSAYIGVHGQNKTLLAHPYLSRLPPTPLLSCMRHRTPWRQKIGIS